MIVPQAKRDEIVADARRMMQVWYDALTGPKGPITHYCLWWGHFTVLACRKAGHEAQLQAGSTFWRSVHPKDDDGTENLSYGFQFEFTRQVVDEISERLPEMHVWACVMDRVRGEVEVVDLTAPFFKPRCLEAGQRWTMPDPPDYFWVDALKFPQGLCSYVADRQATAIAVAILKATEEGTPLAIPIFRR